jgi:glycosyltransferase involved in cell wall biosynthesis
MRTAQPKISVITPVYGVEPYIHDYLESVLNQTYQNLEIICVDDGSPDGCGAILEEYAKEDGRLVVKHQDNAGYGPAINRALSTATGDYIGFADPDDWLEPDFYEKTVRAAESTGADIVVANFYREYGDRSEAMQNQKPVPAYFESRESAMRYGFEADIYRGFKTFLWNKLFRARFFKTKERGGLELRMEPLTTGGGVKLCAECLMESADFAYVDKPLYHYRIREGSLMRSKSFERRLGLDSVLERLAGLLYEKGYDKEIINLVKRFHTYYSSQLAEYAFSIGHKPGLELAVGQIRKYLHEYLESSAEYPERIERINEILKLKL